MAPNVKVFALSTCIHCKQAKQFLDDKNVTYECVHVDLLTGDDRKQVIEEVKRFNPSLSFPTIVIGDAVIVGFRKDDILTALGG
ncbi:MAG: glutaredoxin family protein [Desulfovibrionaceae bacterium]|nr:glutaredoxin family protein [Desulfovibrionaceae bacterium]